PYLPQLVTLPQKPGFPEYTRPGQFAARLDVEYDPTYVLGNLDAPMQFAAPTLSLQGNVSVERLTSRRYLLSTLDETMRRVERRISTFGRQQQRAFTLLGGEQSKAAFDISEEPERIRERYAKTLNGT